MAAPTVTELLPLLVLFGVLGVLVYMLDRARKAPPVPVDPDAPELDTAFVQRETPAMRARRRRGGLSRMRRAAAAPASSDSDDAPPAAAAAVAPRRRAKKKDANREAKREAQQAHLARLEELREREARLDEQRADEQARQREEDERRAEEDRKVAEQKAKKEQEEYENWKDLISVEDAGEAAELEKEDPDLLERFCGVVRQNKIVVLEELAGEFGMRTEDVVDRLTRLEESGEVTGFFDDRGKFVYVSKEEMEDVAQFIKKRGRVSIQELAAESTRLLHLGASTSA